MIALVNGMLALHKQLATVRAGHEKTAIQRQIEATDRQIDNLVYELYGLTEDEIKIVNESTFAIQYPCKPRSGPELTGINQLGSRIGILLLSSSKRFASLLFILHNLKKILNTFGSQYCC